MSETTTSVTDAVPLIRNASLLRLKILAMQPGETLNVKPEDLPRSYKSPKKITTSIRNNYGLFYGVLKLTAGNGWRVVRVNSAEEADSFSPKRKKTKASRQDEPVRLYNMTDGGLFKLILEKIVIATRDIADLSNWGVTLTDLNTLETDNLAFAAIPTDAYFQGLEMETVRNKDTTRTTLENRLGNLRTMAENTFGTASVDYGVFGFEGMAGATDEKLLRLAKRARKQGIANQAAMAVWGCSPAFLTQLKTDWEAFDEKIDNVQSAEANRKKATVLRVKTGNGLYTRIDKICNTGKNIYSSTSEAQYNDYLIYS